MATENRYSIAVIVLHWATAGLVVTAYLLSEGGSDLRTDPPRWHFIVGLAVLALVIPRLLARWLRPVPQALTGSALIDAAARWGHIILYVLLVAVPLSGWYVMSRIGVSLSIFGVRLPALTYAVEGSAGPVAELHQVAGNVLLILAGLHAAMALWHHLIRRDGTLRRISPF